MCPGRAFRRLLSNRVVEDQSYGRGRAPPWPRRVVAKFLANCGQHFARFRLYRRRSLQVNTRFEAFFEIYQIISDYLADIFEIWQKIAKFATVAKKIVEFSQKMLIFQTDCLLKF